MEKGRLNSRLYWDPRLDVLRLKSQPKNDSSSKSLSELRCPPDSQCQQRGWSQWTFDSGVKTLVIDDSTFNTHDSKRWLGGFSRLKHVKVIVDQNIALKPAIWTDSVMGFDDGRDLLYKEWDELLDERVEYYVRTFRRYANPVFAHRLRFEQCIMFSKLTVSHVDVTEVERRGR